MATYPNESAYPVDASKDIAKGLTKREYFAVMAMQGIIASCAIEGRPNRAYVADSAVQYADALIEELNSAPLTEPDIEDGSVPIPGDPDYDFDPIVYDPENPF